MPRDSPAIRLDTSSLKEEKPPTPTLQRETSTRFRPQQLPTPRDVVITQEVEENREKMWDMMSTYLSTGRFLVKCLLEAHLLQMYTTYNSLLLTTLSSLLRAHALTSTILGPIELLLTGSTLSKVDVH